MERCRRIVCAGSLAVTECASTLEKGSLVGGLASGYRRHRTCGWRAPGLHREVLNPGRHRDMRR